MELKREVTRRDYLSFFKYLYSRRLKIFGKIIFIIIILIIGIFVGLLIAGFFGSLDKPSLKVISFVQGIGIKGFGLQDVGRGIAKENIKIPLNYIKGLLSKPKKLYIDVAFQEWKKIQYIRDIALERDMLIVSEDDWVDAVASDGNKKVNVKLRLKGDNVDHLAGEKWSFRIDVKGDETLFGKETFSIQHPKTRSYLYEKLYVLALKKEEVLAVNYDFIEVIINGKNKGIYALEEHFTKNLIESNNKREGPLIKFDDSTHWLNRLQEIKYFSKEIGGEFNFFPFGIVDSFKTSGTLNDPVKKAQFELAKGLLEKFKLGKVKTSEAFDVDILARYFAINTITGAIHAHNPANIRFYYNPITSKLEPIGFDAHISTSENINKIVRRELIEETFPKYLKLDESKEKKLTEINNTGEIEREIIEDWPQVFFKDKIFFEEYIKELERVSKKEYLDELFEENKKILQEDLNIIYKDFPFYHFDKELIYENQNFVARALDPPQGLNAFYSGVKDNKIVLEIGNLVNLPLKIENAFMNESVFSLDKEIILQPYVENYPVKYEKIEFNIPSDFSWQAFKAENLKVSWRILGSGILREDKVIPWAYTIEKKEDVVREGKEAEGFSEFLEIDEDKKIISIKQGFWNLNESLVIPSGYILEVKEGTTLDLLNNSTILSYSPLDFKGSKGKEIKITSTDKTGQGLVVIKTKENNLEYVEFSGLKAPEKDGWILTGAVTFYESDVKLDNILFSGINAEDSLNIIRGNFEIKDTNFINSLSDCLDFDFAKGRMENTEFTNCGNDGFDFSGSFADVNNIKIYNVGDKGVSVGENSNISLKNIEVDNSYIGFSGKDLSNVEIDGIKIKNSKYGFAVYMKKTEFGPANVIAKNVELLMNKNDYIVEKGSSLLIDNKIILDDKKNVFKELYPEG